MTELAGTVAKQLEGEIKESSTIINPDHLGKLQASFVKATGNDIKGFDELLQSVSPEYKEMILNIITLSLKSGYVMGHSDIRRQYDVKAA